MKIAKQLPVLLFLIAMLASCGNEVPTTEETAETENTEETTEETTEEKPKPVVGYQVGDMADDFELKNVDGAMVSMASMTDAKGCVLVFTCNHCPYSIAYEDRLIALDKKYKEQGYPIIAINPNDPAIVPEDSPEEMVKRAEKKGFTFPYLFDEGQTVYPKYGAEKTPHVYVVQKMEEGNKVVYIGAIDDSKDEAEVKEKYLENALDALIKGEEPNPNFTKAFGCSVKCTKPEGKNI